jgi:hypothetical protein
MDEAFRIALSDPKLGTTEPPTLTSTDADARSLGTH